MRIESLAAAAALMGAASVSAAPAGCRADNVLRHLINKNTLAQSFCSTFTTAPTPTGTPKPFPTWMNTAYTTGTYISRLSSACSCLYPASASPTETLTWGSYVPPAPTTTEPARYKYTPKPLPTVKNAPVPLSTAPVADCIPPAPTKNVVYASLGDDNSTAVIAHVNFNAPKDAPLVNLDDLLSGLDGVPVCESNKITLKFASSAHATLAASKWANKFTLITSGGAYCGVAEEHNFWKVSSATASGNSIVLSVTKSQAMDVLESFDTDFGTYDIKEPAPANFRRDLKSRDISGYQVWSLVLDWLTKEKGVTVTTPRYDLQLAGNVLEQVDLPGFSASLSVEDTGVSAGIQLYGSMSFNILQMKATSLILGVDILDARFDLLMKISYTFESKIGPKLIPLATVCPFTFEIPGIISIIPEAGMYAGFEFDIKSALQVDNIGFTGTFPPKMTLAYDFIKGQNKGSSDWTPQKTMREPIFNNGVSLYGTQEGKATAWIGPHIELNLDVLGGAAKGNAELTFQFPAINLEAKLDDLSKCPGASGKDMCVALHSDALIRGTASAGAGIKGLFETGIEHELFKFPLGTIIDDHFKIDL